MKLRSRKEYLAPDLGLSYNSGRIDGQTGTTNNQSSWVGDGFDLWSGFIERRYKPCYDDGVKNGANHLVPSMTFRLHNRSPTSIRSVELMIGFWQDGADGELDNVYSKSKSPITLTVGAPLY